MGNTWVVDMRHYLDEKTGDLPDSLPGRVSSLALFFGSIVSWVTDILPAGDWHTNVPCRRSPGRKGGLGEIFADPNLRLHPYAATGRRRWIAVATSRGFAPRANSARSNRSIETVGSAASIFATRDWLELRRFANVV